MARVQLQPNQRVDADVRRWHGVCSPGLHRALSARRGRLDAVVALQATQEEAMNAPQPARQALQEPQHRRPGAGVEALGRDLRLAVRSLRRSPGYLLAAVVVLALGIGANTAMFSAVHGVLLAPLPFTHGEQLVVLHQASVDGRILDAQVSVPELAVYRQRLHSLRDVVEYHAMSFTLLRQGEPGRVDTGVVSSNFFDVLGVKPLLGRTFVAADGMHGAEPVMVLGHAYWQRKFGGDPRVVGRVVEMNDRQHTIVGVLPDFPQYPRADDIYVATPACPFRSKADGPDDQGNGMRNFAGLSVFGRLRPGTTAATASAEADAIARDLVHEHAADYKATGPLSARVEPLQQSLVREARPMLLALAASTVLVLLLACANVANLALARASRRQRELAVRRALGARPRDLVRQLLVESVLVALAGGGLGVLLAWAARGALASFVTRFSPRGAQIHLDLTVLVFAFGLSLVTGVLFGTLPATSLRRNLARDVRQGAAQSGEDGARQRLRAVLVVGQVAVSFALLVGATLLLSSVYRLAKAPLGFDAEHVVAASFFGNFTSMATPEETLRVHDEILRRVEAAPGVVSAALSPSVPLSNIQPGLRMVRIEGDSSGDVQADPNLASEGYFETLGVPLVAGRSFRRSDDAKSLDVTVINESLARRWHSRDPVGSRILDGTAPPNKDGSLRWLTVVGVVKDFQLYRPDLDVVPQFFVTFRQDGGFAGRVLVRAHGDPHTLVPAIKAAVHAADPLSPVEDVTTLAELHAGRLAAPRLTALLLGIFALVALLVTLVGIGGIVATSVAQRTREFGIRLALGASRGSVLRLVLAQGAILALVGLAGGAFAAHGLGKLLDRYLFATAPDDPRAYVAGAALLLGCALLAAFAPARRATRTEPMRTLRTD
jgi:putative ABC transport system permease protein